MEFDEFLCDILNKKKEKEMFESPERPHRNLSPYLSWFLSLRLFAPLIRCLYIKWCWQCGVEMGSVLCFCSEREALGQEAVGVVCV